MRSFLGPRSERGVTLIEMLLVLGIMGVVGAMGAAQIAEARRSMQGDGAMRLVMSQFNLARQMAVTQRRNIQLRFLGGRRARCFVRQEVPAGTTTLSQDLSRRRRRLRSGSRPLPDTPDCVRATRPRSTSAPRRR